MSKSVLITGCSSGIGYDTAHFLHNQGYKVYATCRDEVDVKRLQKEGLDSFKLDVTCKEDIQNAFERFGKNEPLYALFNNAGYGQPGAIEDISTEALREQFETNFFGTYALTREALKIMRKQGYGRIIEHSSILGLISLRFRGAYNASKYAIEGLSDTLRLELRDTDIHVITINTGPVESNFRKNAIAKFYEHISMQSSIYKDAYEKQVLLAKSSDDDFFTQKSDVVIKNIIHALESAQPKPRYYNTLATHILAFMKRLLSTKFLENLLIRI